MKNRSAGISIRRALGGRGFFTGVLAVVAIIFLSKIDRLVTALSSGTMLMQGFHSSFIMEALSSDAMTLALPVLAALPYAASFIEDIQSGFIKAYAPRTSLRGYLTGKIYACALSGGLLFAVGIAIAYAAAMLLLAPGEQMAYFEAEATPYAAQLMRRLLFFFLSGALWALVGMTASTLMSSRYMAYAAPFIIYYVLIILCERYLYSVFVIYPKEWLNPTRAWVLGDAGAALVLLLMITAVSLLFYIAAGRRIESM